MHSIRILAIAIAAFPAVFVEGQNLRSAPSHAAQANHASKLDDDHRIQPGDILTLEIVDDHKEPIRLRVGVTGQLNAPHIGLMSASGKTCSQLARDISNRLSKNHPDFYPNPLVHVSIDRPTPPSSSCCRDITKSPCVVIFGSVKKQGKFDFIEGETISQAIRRAGGFASEPTKLTVIRKTPQGNRRILANLKAIFRLESKFDLFLRREDVLIVE